MHFKTERMQEKNAIFVRLGLGFTINYNSIVFVTWVSQATNNIIILIKYLIMTILIIIINKQNIMFLRVPAWHINSSYTIDNIISI